MSADHDEDALEVAGLIATNTIESMAQLVGFLSHRSIRVRYEAAKAASGLAAWGSEGQKALVSAEPDPLPILVAMILDTHLGCSAWALSSLSNLCTEESSEQIIKEGAVVLAMERILAEKDSDSNKSSTIGAEGDQSAMLENASKLLANLTRLPQGRAAAVGFLSDGSSSIRAAQIADMCARFVRSRSIPRDPLRSLAFFFENIAMEPEGARLLCDDDTGFLLGVIAKDLALTVCGGELGDNERLMGAAGTLKNCCFQK